MARRPSTPTHPGRTASLAPVRAVELLKQRIDAATPFTSSPGVGTGDLRSWDLTTRAVVAEAFGEPSQNLTSFEHASPDYPWHLDGDEQDRARYNRDTIAAKVTTLQSCIDQLSMGLGGGTGESAAVAGIVELGSQFDFLVDEDITMALRRDLRELETAAAKGLWKCALLLCGSVVEAALIDVLDRRRDLATPYLKKKRFPEDASLHDLIGIAGDNDLIGGGNRLLSDTAVGFAKTITEHRDLIHPHAEVRGHIRVDKETSEAMIHLLKLVVRDLAGANENGVIAAYVAK